LSDLAWEASEGSQPRLVPLEQLDDIRNASCLSLFSNAVLVWNTMAI
jgi:hypothetical protein